MEPMKNIEELPTELLRGIFSHLDDQESIQQSRLATRRFNDAASPFLITHAFVQMTSESISKFEELCSHHVFSKSITDISIIISCYDTTMAADRSIFIQNIDTVLFQCLERPWRGNRYSSQSDRRKMQEDQERKETEKRLWEILNSQELLKISEEGFDESSATPFQQLAMRLHSMYKQRCDDQDQVRRDNKHIGRICAALRKLSNVERLVIGDFPSSVSHYLDFAYEDLKESDFEDLGFKRNILEHFDSALWPSKWCGTFTTAYTIIPPVELLGELCSQIGNSGIRPREMEININVPSNLRILELSAGQQSGLRDLVSKATRLKLVANGWARKGSLAENNDRPRDEMLALCSLTKNFFSAPNLESLYIYFVEYPRFYEQPNVGLADIIPLEKTWPHLVDLQLKYQPATVDDLRKMVDLQRNTVEQFTWECGWLLSGGWDKAIEILRDFEKLTTVSMDYPRGERYGDGLGRHLEVPSEQIYSYILKETNINPLNLVLE